MTNAKTPSAPSLLTRYHFEPELEREFQTNYYARIRPLQRVISLLLALMFAGYAMRDYLDTRTLSLALGQDGAPALFFVLVCASTWRRGFERVWQPVLVAGAVLTAAISLPTMASFLGAGTSVNDANPFRGDTLFFGQQIRTFLICVALLRFPPRPMLLLSCVVLGIGAWAFATFMLSSTPTWNDFSRFFQPTLAVVAAVLLAAVVEEHLARHAFYANHQLEIERNDERRKREHTEKTLHILSQAIGGIVHDLGNPLTNVQMGVATLDSLMDIDADKADLKEITAIIGSGAQMLNYLRLSLIEQTRVLEGRPTPVEVKPTLLIPLLEAGKRFQKPHTLAGREVMLDGDNLRICADEMKLITVFMNLIGNALKYSDGEVRVVWQRFQAPDRDEELILAICDQGTQNRGITQEQAARLFTAFGRLETHANIEGTGLGLLSVQKVVEAHGGEVFIEGFQSGTPDSPRFSTAQNAYPSLLRDEFRTAFVITCTTALQK